MRGMEKVTGMSATIKRVLPSIRFASDGTRKKKESKTDRFKRQVVFNTMFSWTSIYIVYFVDVRMTAGKMITIVIIFLLMRYLDRLLENDAVKDQMFSAAGT